ncbi:MULTISPECIES: hypothetical protein [Xanthocytophaga]|uniref:Uncharacterized protein n=2 Tax=Xanthocytophaga TaxID=3078918 RepID=A0AAE3QP27_9BACT|nr:MULTISPECIES: hypothetical protein [Xanthocytophaga]MDJ1482872.1 hypothetical protein [Xanthocytophaga flavus]MDJ1501564.1 hypothetical protein [Xanthocytophaga agilis]
MKKRFMLATLVAALFSGVMFAQTTPAKNSKQEKKENMATNQGNKAEKNMENTEKSTVHKEYHKTSVHKKTDHAKKQ